eukprot:3262578-Pleurochrysis_carterae.AAC.2
MEAGSGVARRHDTDVVTRARGVNGHRSRAGRIRTCVSYKNPPYIQATASSKRKDDTVSRLTGRG